MGTSIANIALPTLAQNFAAPFHQVQWVMIAYLAAMTLMVVFAGRLGDLYGRRRMLVSGLFLFSVASIFCSLASNLLMLIIARTLQGTAAAFLMTLSIALVRETTNDKRIGRAMGFIGTMSAVGTALGPSLGGMLIGQFGWQAVFFIMAPFGLLAGGLALWFVPAVTPAKKSPLMGFGELKKSGVVISLATNLLVANVMMATLLVGPFYLVLALGLRETIVGLLMSVGPVIAMATGVPSGRLVDKLGAERVLKLGLAMLFTGTLALSGLPYAFGLLGYLSAIAILTPGYQMFQSANNTLVMTEVPENQRGTISGLLSLSRNIGLISGASVMGLIFFTSVGTSVINEATPKDINQGMLFTFLIAATTLLPTLWLAGVFQRSKHFLAR